MPGLPGQSYGLSNGQVERGRELSFRVDGVKSFSGED